MPSYSNVTLRVKDGQTTMAFCLDCGVPVVETETHERFHEGLSR